MTRDKITRRGGDGSAPGFRVWSEDEIGRTEYGDVGILVRGEDTNGELAEIVRYLDVADAAALGGELVAAAIRAAVSNSKSVSEKKLIAAAEEDEQ